MPPGGVSEIIRFFAGQMHLSEDVAKLRDIYLYPAYEGHVGHDPTDGAPSTPAQTSHVSLSASAAFYNIPLDSDQLIGVRAQHHFMPANQGHPGAILQHAPDAPLQYASPVMYPASYTTVTITVTVAPDAIVPAIVPQDEMVNVLQVNKLNAAEFLGVDPHGPGAYLIDQAPGQIEHMLAFADSLIPDGFGALQGNQTDGVSLISTNTDALALVEGHDAALANGSATQHTLALGEYVNGAFEPDYTTPFPQAPVSDVSTSLPAVMGNLNPGLNVVAGSNIQINIGGIFSDNTEHSTLMVLGNYYSTNAIIQTNVLQDIDQITTAGSAGQSHIPATGNDQLNNLASFYQLEYGQASVSGAGNSSWHVNTVNGDFYNVNIVSQTNVLAAGSASFQTTQSTYYQAITGGNQQVNGMLLDASGHPYNLVIVEGNYSNANIIYQTNIVLNNDVVNVSLGDTKGAGMSVSTGGNSLTNAAAIVNYGGDQFATLSGDLAAHAQAAANGAFDPVVAHASAGDGSGQLNVLFVTGNYYDINVVAQTNVLSDSNLAMQLLQSGAPGTTATATVSTGANQAFNLAQIVDVGTSGAQFIGGQHYSDTLLLQANMLCQHATVSTADPQALAHEVIAFVGDDASAGALQLPGDALGTGGNIHHDMMGGVLA